MPGNHDTKLLKKLRGKDVKISHGLEKTLEQIESQSPASRGRVEQFIDKLVGHYVLDDGRLVVAHAGMKERYIGRASRRVREFALYGETTGETDEFGLPVRYNWAAEYRGMAHVVYGHTPVPEADWLNRTINIDTGCVFGGKLTALRWPEKEIISVSARETYAESARPFLPSDVPASLSAQQLQDDLLDLADVAGKRIIATRLQHSVTVRAGKCHGRTGSDEPIRGRPAMADLSPANHVADTDQRRARTAGTSARGLRLFSIAGDRNGGLRRKAHGLARGGGDLPRCRCRHAPIRHHQ